MLEKLIKLVAEEFKGDPTVPSVTCAYLPNGKFYVSIVRYLEKYGNGKQVMFKFQDVSLEKCFELLTEVMERPKA